MLFFIPLLKPLTYSKINHAQLNDHVGGLDAKVIFLYSILR